MQIVDSASEAAIAGVPLDEYRHSFKINLAFNDADVIEEDSLDGVIRRQKMLGSESIIQAKVNWLETAEEIDDLFLGDAGVLSNFINTK
ncbi:probable ribose-5-phosphate isomerase 4 chloroplastic [Phtheirospermum japonicum]|uniref:Probable ribose-5-phosphate isomerase 4 chloroplastic n=1 Tax=Phtheirospermum japonicum TaxID=374723 RepID=A0A830C801_9LAMI|nr:probable ribose-5-phosphate isomerase 4 chloroplastic [Phtheirospermum japonicum]